MRVKLSRCQSGASGLGHGLDSAIGDPSVTAAASMPAASHVGHWTFRARSRARLVTRPRFRNSTLSICCANTCALASAVCFGRTGQWGIAGADRVAEGADHVAARANHAPTCARRVAECARHVAAGASLVATRARHVAVCAWRACRRASQVAARTSHVARRTSSFSADAEAVSDLPLTDRKPFGRAARSHKSGWTEQMRTDCPATRWHAIVGFPELVRRQADGQGDSAVRRRASCEG